MFITCLPCCCTRIPDRSNLQEGRTADFTSELERVTQPIGQRKHGGQGMQLGLFTFYILWGFFFICVCMCVHMYMGTHVWRCTCIHMYVEARSWCQASFFIQARYLPFSVETRSLARTLGLSGGSPCLRYSYGFWGSEF